MRASEGISKVSKIAQLSITAGDSLFLWGRWVEHSVSGQLLDFWAFRFHDNVECGKRPRGAFLPPPA
jgi:hypothetical protein